MVSIESGILYVVATPIGNLGDLAPRALQVLRSVAFVAAEDTRHTGLLLSHFSISAQLVSLHEHNEARAQEALTRRLQAGESGALVCDAGTPLISDPGYLLVRNARAQGIPVRPVPGPSALIAALSVAGLPTDRFVFEGFLPRTKPARQSRLQELCAEPRTLVFYEAPHRLNATVRDMFHVLGSERQVVLARELTKRFESTVSGTLEELLQAIGEEADLARGELVLVVAGAPAFERVSQDEVEGLRVLKILMDEVPLKRAAALAARITGARKNVLYRAGLQLQKPLLQPSSK